MQLTTVVSSLEVIARARAETLSTAMATTPVRLDLDVDPLAHLIDLLTSPSLFEPERTAVVFNLTTDALELLEAHADAPATLVATFTARTSPKLLARLESLGPVERILAPAKPDDQAALLTRLFSDQGVTLAPALARSLATMLDQDWAKALSVARLAQLAGITSPTSADLERLTGSHTKAHAPWDFTDAARRNDPAAALAIAATLEPVPLSLWVSAETLRMARIAEQGLDPARAAKALGIHPFRAGRLVAWAATTTPSQRAALLAAAAKVELAAKSSDAPARTLAALADWLAA
jgi:DNA polymerase III delta subunit